MRLLHALAFFLIAIPQEYCCFVIAPIHRKMRYLKVRCNLKRRAEYFIVKRLPALRIPRDKQTQMSVFALTVQGAMSLRLARKIAADARQSPQAIQRRITKGFNAAGVAILPALNQVQAISTRLTKSTFILFLPLFFRRRKHQRHATNRNKVLTILSTLII